MKKVIFILGLVLTGGCYTAQNTLTEQTAISTEKYVPLSDKRFNEIEDLLGQQEDFTPIGIKNVPRDEIIKFYIKSYNDNIVSTWMNFAYKKMTKYDKVKLGSTQDKSFKNLMQKEQSRANMFKFMSLMTDEQIKTVGY